MKDFVRGSGRLRQLPFTARLTYSVFLAFTLIALGFTAWLGADMLGTDLSGIGSYYAGERAAAAVPVVAPAAEGGGPALDLPSDVLPAVIDEAMPRRKLLEVTHFHLFSMPVYLMILAHLFMLSRLAARTKNVWIAVATLSVALHIAAPWYARSGAAGSKTFYALSGASLMLSFLVLALVPLVEMWLPTSPRR
jgi:hypothetical protein